VTGTLSAISTEDPTAESPAPKSFSHFNPVRTSAIHPGAAFLDPVKG